MKAEPTDQRLLLELQEIDTVLAQLAHRRANLPELAEVADLTRQVSTLEDDRVRVQVDVDDLDRAIARLERDVEQVRARKDRDAALLANGRGPARELEALGHEIESLNRRQRELEDSELELMERREQAQSKLDGVVAGIATAQERLADAERRRDAALTGIAEQEATASGSRAPLAGRLPSDLVSLYERIRADAGGLGAALLRAGRCGGCRLELSGSERAQVKAAPPDEVVRCEECRRIMVRTEESGL
jgi:predicted  nucleic acid-binding Zn-ribbon protein